MSLSKPIGTRLSQLAVTASRRLRREVSRHYVPWVQAPRAFHADARLKHLRWLWARRSDGLDLAGHHSNKMIKEDHLLACTTRMLEIQIALPSSKISRERDILKSNDLDRLDNHCCTQQFPGTHPRGYPTIHLSKSIKSRSFLEHSSSNNFRHPRRLIRLPCRFTIEVSRLGEANTIVRFQSVNGSFRFSFRLVVFALLLGYVNG
jgi:hypothetical protein